MAAAAIQKPGVGYDAFLAFLETPSQLPIGGQKRKIVFDAAAAPPAPTDADKEWQANYEQLKLFHAKNGTTIVPFGKNTGALRSWTERQKKLYASSKLEPEQVDDLRALDFDLTTKKPLASSRSANNVTKKPAPKPAAPAKAASAKKQKKSSSSSMKSLFSSSGSKSTKANKPASAPAPAPAAKKAPTVRKASDDATWNKHYEQLQAFHAKNGNCEVPFGKETGALRSWTERQKKLGAISKLNAERAEKLSKLGLAF
ncbi:hypothetical protein ACHAXT_005852 [Thalassiosira profunda]